MSERTQTLVQLNEELLRLLDRRAASRGVSRSALIRELLERGLERDHADAISARMVDGYRRAPQQIARDEWGDLDRWTDANVRRNLAALAAEETEAW